MRANPLVLLAPLAFLLVLADAAAGAKIYKWVDDKGVTHYGESIPPEYVNRAATEMSKRGVTVRKWDASLTPEQRKSAEEKAVQAKEDQQVAFERRRRDNALVNTYTSSEEIDQARDRTMQLPIQAIRGIEPRLKRAQERLSASQQQADKLTKAGKAVPDGLRQDIADQQADLDSIKTEISQYQAQIETIKTRYGDDKKRYQELTQR